MPTYEYVCKDCGNQLEVMQSIHDDSMTTCPACGGTLRKLFGNVGVVFKGSGFYKTDSRSNGKKVASSSPSSSVATPADSSDSKSSSAGSDSKPAESKSSSTPAKAADS